MASIKLKFRASSTEGNEGTLYYQIIHERKTRQLLTNYHIFTSEWNEKQAMLISNGTHERITFISYLREHIRRDIDRFHRIIRTFECKGYPFSADEIIYEFRRHTQEYSLFNFMSTQIIKLKQKGKIRTSETYTATLNSFKKFLVNQASKDDKHNGEDIMLDSITSDLMESYEAFLTNKGVVPNTISFYMRILRATYNKAVDNNIIEQRHPFRRVYTGIDKTIKRALTLQQIKQIKEFDLSLCPTIDFARDMFMMSFYTRGMSFIDMAFLKKSDLKNGILSYRRRKTGQRLSIRWTTEMQMLLDKYPKHPTQYLLPIISNSKANERYSYRNMSYAINSNLKKVAQIVGINIPLTMYVARHSWASIAKAKGIPISIISEGMGHDSETTTQIYLAALDTSTVDNANSLILNSL